MKKMRPENEERAGTEPHEGEGAPESAPGVAQPADAVDPTADLRRQLDEKSAAYLRVLADFQNYQRRATDNEIRARDHCIVALARAIVPVLEHLDVAVGHDLSTLDAGKLAQAVQAFRDETIKALSKCGVERVEPAVGDEFNPMVHEAVMQQPSEVAQPGHIAACLQAGYRFGEMPLRSAKVSVVPSAN